ncbi:ATP-binding cassette domain-containing protein [Nonomuraea sp. SBT364]|uniref:ATP-binding cassette domain-containing protein n=1 Tax=Nonomuraea sp. SBT364 TaxID=1580530 RepID=UPI000A7EC8D4
MGLTGKRRARFGALSGGWKQRLFIALALVGNPEVVFLDELTTGLDPAARRTTWGLIRDMRDRGVTVVLVTHFMDEADALCDRIAVIDHGRVVYEGTPGELVAGSRAGSLEDAYFALTERNAS